ncbi:MAG: cardiolipin synthase [Lentimonas sp.]|jgi:cardiolipin synthase
MWTWLYEQMIAPISSWLWGGLAFLWSNLFSVAGFALALLIVRRVFSEKRNPSNFFAWFFVVVFFPILGVPLYFMFGGRKSRKMARIKRQIAEEARALAAETQSADEPIVHDISCPEHGHTVTTGNHFELLPDGECAFKRLCHEIQTAEHSIHIATFILGNDATGLRIVELLEQRAREGIQVRLLLDSLGSWNHTRLSRLRIRQAGGQVAMFMPVLPIQTQTSSNLRNHRKIAVFDNYRAITGGQNIDDRFMGSEANPQRFADFSVVTQGPAVALLNRTFLADWAFAAKESPTKFREQLHYRPEEAGDSTIEVIPSGPDIQTDPLWEQIIRIIQEFKRSLTLITPYFIPDEVLFRSLIVKAHTGRHVRLILPLRSNHRLADIARYYYLRQLDAAGVEILFYTPRMLHAKLILADGQVALIGSANIDIRSLFVNFEIGLLHYTASDIEQLQHWADDILPDCISYKEAVKDAQFMPSRFMQDLVNLISPLL